MARRRAGMKRARAKMAFASGVLLAFSYLTGTLSTANAAPPGSMTITDLGCYPSVSVDIRVSLLSTSPNKTNILHIEWSDGTTTTLAPDQEIPLSAVASSQPSDVYHVDWFGEPTGTTSGFTATGTATLTWVSSNGNSKDVATATATRAC
jgi:hypothetical protein